MYVRPKRGLDIKIAGAPVQAVGVAAPIASVALLGADCTGVRPTFKVEVGDHVAAGQAVFVDRRRPEIAFTAPAAGTVALIDRSPHGFEAVVIELDGDDSLTFEPPTRNGTRDAVRSLLLKAGLWPAFLTRPFGRIPDPNAIPDAILVTAMDTNPLAADATVVLASEAAEFGAALDLLAKLTDGPVFVCQAPGRALADEGNERVRCAFFDGPHPAGLPGTHIHLLMPVGGGRVVWHIGYQDVIAIGRLLATGRLWAERVVALAGAGVRDPRLVRTKIGAKLDDLTVSELHGGDFRILSGSPLGGREASFLGRYHTQISVLPASHEIVRKPLLARFFGSGRDVPPPLVPLAVFERVMALEILPVPLLRALAIGDTETAERLGCIELVEEDMALLSYVCASKADYGALLRSVLDELEDVS